jgi:hypothetical protein
MSGEALNKTQFWESPLTVMDDWVRAVKRGLPWRQASQLGQLQFHWGNPPPAAEPKTCTFTLKNSWCRLGPNNVPVLNAWIE